MITEIPLEDALITFQVDIKYISVKPQKPKMGLVQAKSSLDVLYWMKHIDGINLNDSSLRIASLMDLALYRESGGTSVRILPESPKMLNSPGNPNT